MFRELQQAFNVYMRTPAFFVYNTLTYLFFQALLILAFVGVLVLALFVASTVQQSPLSYPMLFLYAVALVIFLYFSSAFQGGLIYGYSKSLQGQSFKFLDFYRYALNNGFRFFWLFVLKLAVEFVLLAPLALLYIYYLSTVVFPYLDVLLLLIVLSVMFIVSFLFFGGFVSAALLNMDARTALSANVRFIRRHHIVALFSFGILAFVWLTNFIPLVQLVSLLFTYPIVLTAYMLYMQNTLESAAPKAPKKGKKEETL